MYPRGSFVAAETTSVVCENASAVSRPPSPVHPGGARPSIYEPANTSAGRIMDPLCVTSILCNGGLFEIQKFSKS